MTTGKAPLLAVVDDDAEVRTALTRLVSSAGFDVDAFASGAEFLLSVKDHEPDCVLLDLHMPGANGFDVLRAMAPAHATVPIIVITGHDSRESRARALRGGARGYLCKPIDGATLLHAIAEVIAARPPSAEGRCP